MASPSRSVPLQIAGVAIATAGLTVGAYAYTGARIYDLTFLFVTIASILLMLAGIAIAAWGRALARAGGSRKKPTAARLPAPTPPRSFPDRRAQAAETAPPTPAPRNTPSLPVRASRFALPRERNGARIRRPDPPRVLVRDVPDPPVVRVRLRCPDCAHEFDAAGRKPFDTRCPNCGLLADVE